NQAGAAVHRKRQDLPLKEALINAVPSEDVPGGMSCGPRILWRTGRTAQDLGAADRPPGTPQPGHD
ncbi:MAG: hypothetical protein QM582_05330, partial [Micropruina sp.]|uniref:hypothetical protein n=1 Tax=Micropruina sp. TaxID=2737536 RepID=UPI0039E2DCE1